MHPSLRFVKHRPWALPSGPWILAQNWHDLLFVHWPVSTDGLRKIIPERLELDLFEGQAWLGVVPFRMSGVRLRGTPALPWLSAFPELNVRTYVVAEGKPGVWFFSLDAANPIAVEAARLSYLLPYFRARMTMNEGSEGIVYRSRRTDHRGNGEALEAIYSAEGEVFEAKRGTQEYFLVERYCLYAQSRNGDLLRGEIHHPPWRLQAARACFKENTMASPLGIRISGAPTLHFSRLQEAIVWWPEKVKG
jgi:uncharacterized protein